MKERVFISIGSNEGVRSAHLAKAIEMATENGPHTRLVKRSSFYETSPWGRKDQPAFLNCVMEIETSLPPHELLTFLKGIEAKMGRAPARPAGWPSSPQDRWGPRTIDLDIIFYGDRVVDARELKIPHPLAHKRGFVLIPLSEIAPDVVHPVLKKTVSEITSLFKDSGDVRKME
ncbi:MAG: 2-amino-4-hydroxy-6-hydroxymethyldihydropteridine diphosphokinase [Deltaproteobacteria bacterium]|nr:2-amino-4-hydroxy-6-hydroxymethyldihydropteridine diphosphokinase [Deltaproteobacteria bacterium]